MKIITGPDRASQSKAAVLALGNFDGVHEGHQSLLNLALSEARASGLDSAVAVFDPHPRRFFAPDSPPFRLMSAPRRAATLARMGFDRLHVLPFDAAMAARSPESFVVDILKNLVCAKTIMVGRDFQFGKDRAGDFDALQCLCAENGMTAHAADLAQSGGEKISSSQIRCAIGEGRMADAAQLLGRPWTLDGIVELGDQRGRIIGFPTANVALGDCVRPAYGVYAVTAQIEGKDMVLSGVANMGVRPTVDGQTERLEVHLFDFDADIYGKTLCVSFHEHLRGEQKFDGLDALKAQIELDANRAKACLAARLSGPA